MCGTKVFCRFREYQRAHTQTPFPWYFQLQEQCLLERQFISLEENKEWINATTREHFIFFINSQFKLVHADSHNVTAMLRKNICFPYRNNKNFPKLSYKILFLLQPVTMQSNHKETFRRIMQKCLPQLMLNCSLQHFEAVSFPMSYGHYILVLRLFSRKGSLTQASLAETQLLHSLPLLPQPCETQSLQGGEIHHVCSDPLYYKLDKLMAWLVEVRRESGPCIAWKFPSQNLRLQLTDSVKPTLPSTMSLQHPSHKHLKWIMLKLVSRKNCDCLVEKRRFYFF